MDKFLEQRKNAWQRLEDLLRLLDSGTLRKLNREEVRELGHSYRRAAADLAVARAESRDPRLINYLNSLVIRAHGRIYRAEAKGGQQLRKFFQYDFPNTFRRTLRYTLLSFVVFWAFFAVGFLGTRYDPEFSELAGVDAAFRESQIETKTRWWLRLNEANQVGASSILTNNIGVTFLAFAYGALLGIGTLYVLAMNGLSIGAVLALVYRAGYGNELLAFMAGHGVIELSCIFIAGGAGLLIGGAMLMPGDLSRFDALKARGLDAIRLIAGCAVLLVVAGLIEGFVSPAPISPKIKFGVAVITGIMLYTYLFTVGRNMEISRQQAAGSGQ
jgi:uncharacterized membrane protein SpoIIM required for sporulation